MSEIDDLIALLDGALVTFDTGRDFTHPCTFCGTSDEPRELVDIGTYVDGETITRPVCPTCMPIAKRRGAPSEGANAEQQSITAGAAPWREALLAVADALGGDTWPDDVTPARLEAFCKARIKLHERVEALRILIQRDMPDPEFCAAIDKILADVLSVRDA